MLCFKKGIFKTEIIVASKPFSAAMNLFMVNCAEIHTILCFNNETDSINIYVHILYNSSFVELLSEPKHIIGRVSR